MTSPETSDVDPTSESLPSCTTPPRSCASPISSSLPAYSLRRRWVINDKYPVWVVDSPEGECLQLTGSNLPCWVHRAARLDVKRAALCYTSLFATVKRHVADARGKRSKFVRKVTKAHEMQPNTLDLMIGSGVVTVTNHAQKPMLLATDDNIQWLITEMSTTHNAQANQITGTSPSTISSDSQSSTYVDAVVADDESGVDAGGDDIDGGDDADASIASALDLPKYVCWAQSSTRFIAKHPVSGIQYFKVIKKIKGAARADRIRIQAKRASIYIDTGNVPEDEDATQSTDDTQLDDADAHEPCDGAP